MKHIHLIGICGTGMGSLAGLLLEAGYKVSGSDTQFYPPMGEQLKKLPISLKEGFHARHLEPKPDAVVIGNVCRRENPEATAAIHRGIPYYSFPQALQELFLKERKALVVAGTHGKTTTATMLAAILTHAGREPGFLIGGVGLNFNKSYACGKGEYFVVEGDEYDSAFFDKGPKFAHFRPEGAILTSIEWDHVDIYPTFEEAKKAFRKFGDTLRPETTLLAVNGSPAVQDLVENSPARVLRYGLLAGDYKVTDVRPSPEGTNFKLLFKEEKIPLFLPMSGKANLENGVAVAGLCRQLGLSWEEIREGLKNFKGIRRRQEVKGIVKNVTVIDDFAHHPTAVRRTIEALKERYPEQRLIIVFEPRSNTSRRAVHYKEYTVAFKGADRVILASPYHSEAIPKEERLDTHRLADDLMRRGIDAYAVDHTEGILEFILRGIGPNEVVAFFSNGDFNNIHEKLLAKLERRKIFADRKDVRSTKVTKPN